MKRLLPLSLLLLACNSTEPPQTKKASLGGEACVGGQIIWKPDPPPLRWEAYRIEPESRFEVQVPLIKGQLKLPCTEKTVWEIYYVG